MRRLLFLPLLATMIAVHAQDIKEGETLQEFSSGRKYRDIQRTMNHRDTETGILQNK